MEFKKRLPIGSVVLLKNGTKKIMIIGYLCKENENSNVIFDYSACLFPEGLISSNKIMMFNHEQIDKVEYIGYINNETQLYNEKLDSFKSLNE